MLSRLEHAVLAIILSIAVIGVVATVGYVIITAAGNPSPPGLLALVASCVSFLAGHLAGLLTALINRANHAKRPEDSSRPPAP